MKKHWRDMSIAELREQHIALWQWLADNPINPKQSWPGWEEISSPGDMPTNNCFACAVTKPSCARCPLDHDIMSHCNANIEDNIENGIAAYDQWIIHSGRHSAESQEAARAAALAIRDAWPEVNNE